MLFRKQIPEARFISWAFLCLIILFVILARTQPGVGLSGLGGVLVLAALLVLANKNRIWEEYKKDYKHDKNDPLPESLTKPNMFYYNLNVYIVWPIVFLAGLGAIWAGYLVG